MGKNYISKWKASEIDELLGKAIDKTIVEKGDGALELKIILKDGSSVTLPIQLGSGLSVDNDGTISVNDTFQFGGIVSGVSVETSSTQATSGMIVFDTELNVFLLRSGLKYYMGWNSSSEYLVSSAEWEKRKTTSGSKFYIDNEDETLTWYVSNGSTLLMSGGGLSQEAKDYTDEKVSAVANGQLKLSVKDNGNVVLSNAAGESKEFMPATPSGDPMHYAYINAGAEYNATGADIVKNAPWADLADTDEDKVVVHKAGCWYLNGLGDLTNTDMSNIYRRGHVSLETDYLAYTATANNIKTNLDCIYKVSYSLLVANFMAYNHEIIVLNTSRNNRTDGQVQWNSNNSFTAASQPLKLSHILGEIIKTPQNAMIQRAPSLKTIKIKGLTQNISFPSSPMLTTASVLYMINNSTATSAITITLHADAYARAMADARIVEALAAQANVTLASA